ncbi:hypothetical protein Vadar_015514 [Vaccinium darrowii]|uniref:Uncharacterized protein n=1 Tax=Vaccinium darrowii TaxID=229202 RepID=A0ACB7X0V9_9ERIC|nr:hypothetical protein Vadar_015514 [Vaccinium darrowii]
MANKNDDGRRRATITIYRECERNHSTLTVCHVVDSCLEFLGYRDDHRSEVAFYCSTCCCNRNFHGKEETTILVDPTTVRNIHELAAIPPPHRGGAAGPMLPPQPPQVPYQEVSLGDEDLEQEERAPKKERIKYTEAQKEAMREYAERLGWRRRKRGLILVRLSLLFGNWGYLA